MSKIAEATARPWQVGLHIGLPVILDANGSKIADIIFERGVGAVLSDSKYRHQLAANARLIVQAVNSFEAMREMLFRALVELSYVQSVENCESGLCASAEGKSIIEEGMKLLGVKDLSEDALKGEHNAD